MVPEGVAVLVGNGLSIAANPQLHLDSISRELKDRLLLQDETQGRQIVEMMEKLAEKKQSSRKSTLPADFEELIGVLEDLEVYLREFSDIYLGSGSIGIGIEEARTRAKYWHSLSVVCLLEIIYERSTSVEVDSSVVQNFLKLIIQSFPGVRTFGNLNYDPILLHNLHGEYSREMADMGHGWKQVPWEIAGIRRLFRPLRNAWETPANRPIKLVHLHGAINFWEIASNGQQVKAENATIRDADMIRNVGMNEGLGRPLVVVTKARKKSSKVLEEPFSLAYKAFSESLRSSNFWIIAGYSFRDDSVNQMLARELLLAQESARRVKLLVVVKDDSNVSENAIKRDLNHRIQHLSKKSFDLEVCQHGLEELSESREWQRFISHVVPF